MIDLQAILDIGHEYITRAPGVTFEDLCFLGDCADQLHEAGYQFTGLFTLAVSDLTPEMATKIKQAG